MSKDYGRENNIIIDGVKYYTGTVFIVDFHGKHREASFVCRVMTEPHNKCVCIIDGMRWFIDIRQFTKMIVSVAEKFDSSVHMPVTKTMKESHINGMLEGWLWYIFLMAISAIFKDAIGLWIFISVVFFSWRKKKIQEEGTYPEW